MWAGVMTVMVNKPIGLLGGLKKPMGLSGLWSFQPFRFQPGFYVDKTI
jgi:hypothetical protein